MVPACADKVSPGRHSSVTHMTSSTTNHSCRSTAVSKGRLSARREPLCARRRGPANPGADRLRRSLLGLPFGPPAGETAKVGACSVVLRPSGRTPPPRGECAADAHAAVGPRARPRPHSHHRRNCSNGDGGRVSATTPRPDCESRPHRRTQRVAGRNHPQARSDRRAAQAPHVALTSPPVTGNHQGVLMTDQHPSTPEPPPPPPRTRRDGASRPSRSRPGTTRWPSPPTHGPSRSTRPPPTSSSPPSRRPPASP